MRTQTLKTEVVFWTFEYNPLENYKQRKYTMGLEHEYDQIYFVELG